MEIKNIKKLSNGKYQIVFVNGDKINTYDEVLLKDNILYKKDLTVKEIDEINKKNEYYNVYNNAIKYITKKMRTTKEMNQYLEKYELSKKDKEKIITSLKENGLLNDSKYIKAFISDKLYLSNDGPNKIKKDLLKYDLNEEEIDNILENINYDDLKNKVEKIIKKKLNSAKGSSYNIKQKIISDMYNMGYSKDLIDTYLNTDIDDSNFLNKDFEKVYKTIIKKEIDNKIIHMKVKQKLYQKGYSLSDIEKLLNEKGL